MRPAHALLAVALLAGCGEDAPLPLPAGEVLGGGGLFVRAADGGLFWFEIVRAADPRDEVTRLWTYQDGAAVMLDEVDANIFIDTAGPFVLRDGDELVWGFASAFIGCGAARWVRPGVPAVPVAMWTEPTSACRSVPIALRGGTVWAATPGAPPGEDLGDTVRVTSIDLATDARTPVRELPGALAFRGLTLGDDGYLFVRTLIDSDETRAIGFPLAGDPDARWIGPTIRTFEGAARAGDRLAWLDDGAFGEPARVLVATPDHERLAATTVATLATLPAIARGLEAAGDDLWTTPLVRTAIQVLPPRELWRIGADGAVTVVPADGDVWATAVAGGAFWAAVAHAQPDGTSHTTELLRVDADGARTRFALDRDVDALAGTADALVVRAFTYDPTDGPHRELVRYRLADLP